MFSLFYISIPNQAQFKNRCSHCAQCLKILKIDWLAYVDLVFCLAVVIATLPRMPVICIVSVCLSICFAEVFQISDLQKVLFSLYSESKYLYDEREDCSLCPCATSFLSL